MAGFLLLALSWAYVNIDDAVRDARSDKTHQIDAELTALSDARQENEEQVWRSSGASEESLAAADRAKYDAMEERDAARERYRATLDEGNPSAALKREYRASEEQAESAKENFAELEAKRDAALAKLDQFDVDQAGAIKKLTDELDAHNAASDRIIFFLRLLLTLGALGLSVLLLRIVTERAPRGQPLAQAFVIASSLMVLTLVVDYSEISFDFETVGPLGMAFLGAIVTIGAFFGLQRFLRTRRPNRRLRAGECMTCGYPGGTNYCENCGEQLATTCNECGAARRIGVSNCGSCGAA